MMQEVPGAVVMVAFTGGSCMGCDPGALACAPFPVKLLGFEPEHGTPIST